MEINVLYHPEKEEAKKTAKKILEYLKKSNSASLSPESHDLREIAIAIGGDGFAVRTAAHYSKLGIPTIAINAGDVGFLTRGNVENWEDTLRLIVENRYVVEKRIGLNYLYNGHSSMNPIVNDVYFKHTLSVANFRVLINGEETFSSLSADGLIVSTPTGSTGYCSSADGPIVQPGMNCLIFTPICPYHLHTKPLVLLPETEITIEVLKAKRPGNLNLVADGQIIGSMEEGETVVIKKHTENLLFAVIDHHDFYRALQEKKGLMK